MRWQRLVVSGFQSFVEPCEIIFAPDLTLIAGRNDVGKSALLRVLRMKTEAQIGFSDVGLVVTWDVDTAELEDALVKRLGRSAPGKEMLGLIKRAGPRQRLTIELGGSFQPTEAVQLDALDTRRVGLDDLGLFAGAAWIKGPLSGDHEGISDLRALALRYWTRVAHILPRRPQLGPQTITGLAELAPGGENLTSAVVHMLLKDRSGVYAALEGLVTSAFPDVREIGLMPSDGGGSSLAGELLVTYRDGRQVPLTQCGTGIEQMLALGVAVLTHRKRRLLLIDEPTSFLHPAAERVLIDFLRKHPEHQYVVATHSNVFLNAFPLTSARLLTKGATGTAATSPTTPMEILEEVGLRAGDLWLSDRVVWVEGPSELAACRALVELGVLDSARLGDIRELPALGRFLGSKAESAFRVVEGICEAITRVPVDVLFVFDSDEKSEQEKARIVTASRGSAVFLGVRELENCYLDAAVVAERLRSITGRGVPTDQAVQEAINERLADRENRSLFPRGPRADDARQTVRAHALLADLYWHFARSPYDKPREAAILTKMVWRHQPVLLDPFIEALGGDAVCAANQENEKQAAGEP